jgi:hypothetical protein
MFTVHELGRKACLFFFICKAHRKHLSSSKIFSSNHRHYLKSPPLSQTPGCHMPPTTNQRHYLSSSKIFSLRLFQAFLH